MIVKKNIYFEIFFFIVFFSVPLVSAMYGKCICIRKCDCKCNVLLPDMATLYALSRLTLPPTAGPVSIPHVSVMSGSLEHSYLE